MLSESTREVILKLFLLRIYKDQRIAYSRSSSLCPFLSSTQKLQNSSFAFTSLSIDLSNSFIAKTLHLISLLELA
ncbi:hypothetical protein P8452_21034 [Trifolium repens]|nr:hypothetical protein P8452_21034 [Trifolium repens]